MIKAKIFDSDKDISAEIIGKTIELTLFNKSKILIEVFERRLGQIDISAGSINMPALVVKPVAGNKISIRCE